MEFYMENKTKNIIIVIEAVIIVALIVFMVLGNSETKTKTGNSNLNTQETENISEDTEKLEYIKTYNIIQKLDISDETENYDFYVIQQFQDNDNPVLIKVEKTYNLEEGENYEIVLYGVKEEGKTYTQNEIFENFEIQDIRKTDKTGLDQIQDL